MSPDAFLGRALMDPATGLPNAPYFRLIREWEKRRARRHRLALCVVRITIEGGDDRSRRALVWRLCRELRDSDFLAATGPSHFRILITAPGAGQVETVCERVQALIADLNLHVSQDRRLTAELEIEEVDGETGQSAA